MKILVGIWVSAIPVYLEASISWQNYRIMALGVDRMAMQWATDGIDQGLRQARRQMAVNSIPQFSHADIPNHDEVARRRKYAMALAALGLVASAGTAHAGCRIDRIGMGTATTSYHTNMRVEKNSTCGTHIMDGHAGAARNYRISIRASHGQAAVENLVSESGFAYKPNPGYVGNDHFQISYEIITFASQTKVQATMDVDVEVADKM
jgi:hypothetical protein